MYLDILPNDNLSEACQATFKETAPGRTIRAIRLWRDGSWQWCAVTGWSGQGPVAARLTPIEESGDGPARLITGGEHGMRLTALAGMPTTQDDPIAWDLNDGTQWAEPFLICTPEVETA